MYPRALENRLDGAHPSLTGSRRKFLKSALLNCLLLQVLFLGLFAYIFGALFQQGSHIQNLKIIFVDYDGGMIGESIRNSYNTQKGESFPTLTEEPASDYPTSIDLVEAVCNTHSWAALYVTRGASVRLEDALYRNATYNASDTVTYIWNEARYSATIDSLIQRNIETLSSDARASYISSLPTEGKQVAPSNGIVAMSALANPWKLTSMNIQPTLQGSRLIYNTLVIILIMIQEFFYLGILNVLYIQFKIYNKIRPARIIIYRTCISLIYTFFGSLCCAGSIWAFRAGWNVNGNQFVLTWAILWLFAHVNYLTLDVFTIWFPPLYVPMAFVTWIVLNVTAVLLPFDLMPGFYRWSYALPANAVYGIMTDIWSRGCNPQIRYSLPIIFALEIIALILSAIGVYRRCHLAVLGEEVHEKAFRTRLEGALKLEREGDTTQDQKGGSPMDPHTSENMVWPQ
jgi:hypothetical protein